MKKSREKEMVEKILRHNLISAYLDYAKEFGEEKAREVMNVHTSLLKTITSIKEKVHEGATA